MHALPPRSLVVTAGLALLAVLMLITSAPLRSTTDASDGRPAVQIPTPPPPSAAALSFAELRTDGVSTRTPVLPLGTPPLVTAALVPQYRAAGSARVYRDRPASLAPGAIVVHGTGGGTPGSGFGSVFQLRAFFARPSARAASQYGIDRDGRILQFVPDDEAAFHVATNGWNDLSIGIELVNDNTGIDPFPSAQRDALTRLVRYLATRYDIPVEAVVRHRDVQPVDRSDPASNFPWAAWKRSLVPR
ncbi:MAG: N-acetylmuramyl-L-alanine amidase, negative regulator of AmpC, AmpD [Thermoleophilia bacterium]|nr:N-acetylmuramyl-L-alanine amidase, negative regulator of AmpC, AmpD [Thermoleophilia bacterium]